MQLNRFEVLSKAEIEKVHEASLDILENTGIKMMSDSIMALLENAGCPVDHETRIVKIPRKIVEDCLKLVPSKFDLYDRNGNKCMTIGDGTVHNAAGHNAVFCVDSESLERKYATVKDVEEFGIVSQWCEGVDIVGAPLNPMGVNPDATLLHAAKALFKTTTKPLFLSTESTKVVLALLDMMRAVAGTDDIGAKPNAILQLSPSSPLFWGANTVEGFVECAKAGVPLVILPEPMAGVSAPYSVSGLLLENNAEALSGVVIAELANPGCPLMYGASWTTYDMRYSVAKIGAPEAAILQIAGEQMAHFYNMPSHTTASNSDSNAHDERHAWESVLNVFTAMNSGNDTVINAGMFACGLTTSLEQLVMDNEIIRYARRLIRGIDASDEVLGADVIKEVGPCGNFLMEEHTVDNLYSGEFWEPTIKVNQSYDNWAAEGYPTVDKDARKLVNKILEEGNKVPLDAAVEETLNTIIKTFEEE